MRVHIDAILSRIKQRICTPIDSSWAQKGILFEGITGAVLCQAAMDGTERGSRLRQLHLEFVRPVLPAEPYIISEECIAQGSAHTSKEMRLIQGGKVRVTARAGFFGHQPPAFVMQSFSSPSLGERPDGQPLRRLVEAEFLEHFDYQVIDLDRRGETAATPTLAGWMRFKHPPKVLTEAHLVAMIDAWPPLVQALPDTSGALRTLNWSFHFFERMDLVCPNAPLGYRAQLGFGTQDVSVSTTEVWTREGTPLARSFQTNAIVSEGQTDCLPINSQPENSASISRFA